MNEDIKIGDLVWAKMKGYPPWPAKVVKPNLSSKGPKNKKTSYVYFFGTRNFAQIPDKDIFLHSESYFNSLTKKKSKIFQQAINELKDETMKHSTCASGSSISKVTVKNESETTDEIKKVDDSPHMTSGKKLLKTTCIVSDNVSSQKSSKPKQKKQTKKVTQIVKVPYGFKNRKKVLAAKRSCKRVNRKSVSIEENTDAPSTSYLTEQCSNSSFDSLYSLNSQPSSGISSQSGPSKFPTDFMPDKTIGFIGLDIKTRIIVEKVLKSNFNTVLWVEEVLDQNYFYNLGAALVDSPLSVVAESDLIFCYYTDTDWFRKAIFGLNGVLDGFELSQKLKQDPKGLVLLSVVDDKIAQKISKAVNMKKGLYLEAPISGTESEIAKGNLLVQASGDRQLFIDCEDFFKVIARYYDFVSCKIGYGSKIAAMSNMLNAGVNAVCGETVRFANKLGINPLDMQEVIKGAFEHGSLIEKMVNMGSRDFKEVITPLKHAQKDLNLASDLSDSLSLSMPIAAGTNELFKRARQLNYSEADVTSIYKVVKYF